MDAARMRQRARLMRQRTPPKTGLRDMMTWLVIAMASAAEALTRNW
jgi:hypothetical protein